MPKLQRRSLNLPPSVPGSNWIPLTQGRFALIDETDFTEVNKHWWSFTQDKTGSCKTGYARSRIDGKIVLLHHFILGIVSQVDHIDGNGLNNKRTNLRLCSQIQNSRNRSKNKNNSSGYKGVSWQEGNRIRSNWRATINVDGKQIYLGSFKDKEEAAKAYNLAAIQYFGEFANLNKLPDSL